MMPTPPFHPIVAPRALRDASGAEPAAPPSRHAGSRAGFSLIEVMVATLILLVIVMMIGEIFRQGTSSWDSGYARAEGGMIVRGVIGSMQRELSSAVDGRLYPGVWRSHRFWDFDDPVDVQRRKVTFICLKESTGTGDNLVREPWLIEYEWRSGREMTRNAWRLFRDKDGEWVVKDKKNADNVSVIYSEDHQDDKKAIYSAEFTFSVVSSLDAVRPAESKAFEDDIFWNIPYVTIEVELWRTSSFSGIEVRSWGPDGVADTADDIIVQ